MDSFGIRLMDSRFLKFEGEKIGSVSDNYDNNRTRWSEYELYLTKAGKYILLSHYLTRCRHEDDADKFKIFENISELHQYAAEMGNASLFELLDEVDLPFIINID